MRAKRFFLLFFLSIFFTAVAGGEPSLLASTDVRKVMDQLFEFHVDKKEMQPQIMGRSLKIFIDNFDSQHAYLTLEEVSGYLNPTERALKAMVDEYQKDQFSTFVGINDLIQKSIYRARRWREEWSQNPKKLIEEAKIVEAPSTSARSFPNRLVDLKKRHHQLFLQLISFQVKQNQNTNVENKDEKIISFCERQLRLIENPYLGIGEQGEALSSKEKDHQVWQRILKAFAHSLDAHTAYYSPEEAFAMKVQLEKGMCGIGVVLHEELKG